MRYWLMKSEPSCFSIDDLVSSSSQITAWDGVRNYQARNFMQKDMCIGDQVFFYHSNCNPKGIVGIVEVISKAYPDHSAFDLNSQHPDPKSTKDNPLWYMVDVLFKKKFNNIVTLQTLKSYPNLKNMRLLQKGNRLSILPVSKEEWQFICTIADSR